MGRLGQEADLADVDLLAVEGHGVVVPRQPQEAEDLVQATAPVLGLIVEEAVVQDGYMNALTDGFGET